MAAALLRALLSRRLGDRAGGIEVRTAGLAVACPGECASPDAGRALAERGIDLGPHRARQLSSSDLDWADLILTMSASHKAQVLKMAPWAADRTFVLREYTGCVGGLGAGESEGTELYQLDVPDPIGRGLEAYRAVASLLEKELASLVELIAGEEASALTAITAAGPDTAPRPEPAAIPSEDEWAATRSLAVGADHAGYEIKQELCAVAAALGYEVVDFGTNGPSSVDYPDFAVKVAAAVASKRCNLGLLVCGTGIGMAIAANKIRGIRAATCNDLFLARMAREHNDANILCLGARVIGGGLATEALRTFLSTPFGGDRHVRRLRKIDELEPPSGKELC
jgi:ribose 5-phosphate isomerase B